MSDTRGFFSRFNLLTTIFCLALSACNYPGAADTPNKPSLKEIRQTLDAISVLNPSLEPSPGIDPRVSTQPTNNPQSTLSPLIRPDSTPLTGFERIQYFSQEGDTLPALTFRFNVLLSEIVSSEPLPTAGLIPSGTELWFPNRIGSPPFPEPVLPDMEVINGPSAAGFSIQQEIDRRHGYLSNFVDIYQSEKLTAAKIIERVSIESSINPRILLALIELQSGWLTEIHVDNRTEKYPVGFHINGSEGLYRELLIAATHLNAGYYGWRDGSLTKLQFSDGSSVVIDPRLNAGTVAVQNLFTRLYRKDRWQAALYGPGGFLQVYQNLFGDPWELTGRYGSLLPGDTTQPFLVLPFKPGERWSLTGGPHLSWKTGTPRGALDFAPVTGEIACAVSYSWVLAPAAGVIVRSFRNVVALDLDGDGYEQTGWVIVFMHIADHERIANTAQIAIDDRLGHPSCEGGASTGTHFHIARKFNGEWIAADGPLPFVLSGWQVFAEEKNYQGGMSKDGQQIVASPVGPRTSIVVR